MDVEFVLSMFDPHPLLGAMDKAAFENFRHAATRIMKDAKESILVSDDPSTAGMPPHTRRAKLLKRAIQFAASKTDAAIGPIDSLVGRVGQAHEFGGAYKGDVFDARPFMGPALEKNVARFAEDWQGSIGQ